MTITPTLRSWNPWEGGVAILDYDANGWRDLFCMGGGRFGNRSLSGNDSALYRNLGEWPFTEVTRSANCGRSPHFSHGAAADADNVVVTGYLTWAKSDKTVSHDAENRGNCEESEETANRSD